MNESEVFSFIGEVRAELRAIHGLLQSLQDQTGASISDLDERLDALEQWKSNLMGRMAVVGTVLAAVGAVLLALLN